MAKTKRVTKPRTIPVPAETEITVDDRNTVAKPETKGVAYHFSVIHRNWRGDPVRTQGFLEADSRITDQASYDSVKAGLAARFKCEPAHIVIENLSLL
jgi:hypothetical protein